MNKMKFESPDLTSENIEKLAALFPNCVTEASDGHGKAKRAVNFELLRQMLSPDVVDGDERYEFTWVGKKESIVEANKPIRKTLRPCKEESKNWDTTPPATLTTLFQFLLNHFEYFRADDGFYSCSYLHF